MDKTKIDSTTLSRKTGIATTTLNSLKRGIGNPTLSTLQVLSDFFNVSIRILGYDFAASGLIYSLSFLISSIITEVYGYKLAGRIIWAQMVCNIIFVLTLNWIVLLPSPPESKTHMLYFQLYGHVYRVLFGSCTSIPIAYFVRSKL